MTATTRSASVPTPFPLFHSTLFDLVIERGLPVIRGHKPDQNGAFIPAILPRSPKPLATARALELA